MIDLIEWTAYGEDGMQGAEFGPLLLLVKYLSDSKQWVYIVGDVETVVYTGFAATSADARALAIRYCWAVNNITPERAKELFN